MQTGVDEAITDGAGVRGFLELCEELTRAPDAEIRQGAADIRTWVEKKEGWAAR
ncbi:hypothetical protein [Streptomyces sp. NPDC058657]|uniref:hypothetical protein n=1 Tax=unclassified Streptomyces TaxID=2593676 RepID=UPI00364A35F2